MPPDLHSQRSLGFCRRLRAAALTAVLALAPLWSSADTTVADEILHLLQPATPSVDGIPILAGKLLGEAYREFDYRPFWSESVEVDELFDLLENAADHGLDPQDYDLDALRAIVAERSATSEPAVAARADVLLTESLLRYGYHRRFGKIRASSLDPNMNYRREAFPDITPGAAIRQAIEAPSLRVFIQEVAPTGPVYRALQAWLRTYRDLGEAGGWPEVPAGATLHPGDRDERVLALRDRLAVSGDLPADAPRTELFDVALTGAVKQFQYRHGLAIDGVVGKATLAALNVPVRARIDQLRLALERLRWVNGDAQSTMVAVNIAGFEAFYFHEGETVWETRAMVGTSYRETPTLRGEMTYLEFNPTWTIPPGILRKDTLPAIRKDPGYLASKRIRVIGRDGREVDPATVDWSQYTRGAPFTFVQDPWAENALGRVKFIFPNPHFVFLHDTPQRELFDRPDRAFSSGCIRIEDPLRLAELLLNDPQRYSRQRLEEIVASGKTERVLLSEPVPVLIVYLTAGIDGDGVLMFYPDIYGRDAAALAALDGPVTFEPPPAVSR